MLLDIPVPYKYIEDIATADAAFEAWGETAEEMFTAAAEALMNVMVSDLETIRDVVRIPIQLQSDDMEMLLYELLQELIFYKDARLLLLRVERLRVDRSPGAQQLHGELYGEELDPLRHDLVVDVKAVTFHRFRVEETEKGWEAFVIVDI